MNDNFQSTRDARVSIENAIVQEIGACGVGRCPNINTSGHIFSHFSALTTRDSVYCIPDVVPVGDLAWPAPLLSMTKKKIYNSFCGIFPSICRTWLVIDNQLILWNYRSGREICQYDEIPELILVVGNPVRPKKGVFQHHILFVLPVATSKVVYLLGVSMESERDLADLKLINLGYSVVTPSLLTKIVGVTGSGRFFCAGADGNLYELQYARESTPFIPRIRMICFSFFLSKWPVLGHITSIMNTVIQTWTNPRPGLCDLIVDERHDLLFTLDEKSVISVWRIFSNDLKLLKSLAHQPSQYLPSGVFTVDSFSSLCKLFLIDPDCDGCTLTAISVSGEHFRYRYADYYAGSRSVELLLRGYTPSFCKPSREVGVCYASGSMIVLSSSSQSSGDELVVVTSPNAIMEPHSKFRNIVTTFDPSDSQIIGVDAIEVVSPIVPRKSPNELCSQVSHSSSFFAVVHQHGLSFFLKMSPVDTLYTIMCSSDVKNRESLLQRFAGMYNTVDYTAMLLQIAIGAANVSYFVSDPPIVASFDKLLARTTTSSSQVSNFTADHLGAILLDGTSAKAKHLAQGLLRNVAAPSTQSDPPDASGMRQVTIFLSPYLRALLTYIARALYDVWDIPIHELSPKHFRTVEAIFSFLVRFLESSELVNYNEESLRVDISHRWEVNKVLISLPTGTTLSFHDINKLEIIALHHAYQLARKCLQTALLLHRTSFLPLRPEERLTSFGQIVRDEMVARRLGQYYSQLILSSQKDRACSTIEEVRSFTELQRKCPYFFTNAEMLEASAQSGIAELTHGGNLELLTSSQLDQWMASAVPRAGSHWLSGALQTVCQQLKELKREDLAVQLLLHAARQIDPNNVALTLYLAEHNGHLAQENVTTAFYTLYQTKCRALQLVVSTLESAWLNHRSVTDILLGSSYKSGAIWEIEPSDEFAHYFLFDWMHAPREDPNLTRILRDTLVTARSPFLEKYLTQKSALLGEEYARYLRRTKGDYKAAIEHSVVLAQSPLLQIPRADRLAYRIRCLNEARECASECGSEQIQQVEQLLSLLDAQQRLLKIITDYIGSGQLQLDKAWYIGQRAVTERELALKHVEQLSEGICGIEDILQISGMYTAYGGAEVQLDLLISSNVTDSSVFAMCILRAYQIRDDNIEDLTRRLIECYYKRNVLFPITTVIQVLESCYYVKFPEGSKKAAALLLEFGVDVKVLFYSYQDLIEERYENAGMCEAFTQAGVTTAYLVHTLAFILYEMAKVAHRGALRTTLIIQAMRTVQDYISLCASSRTIDKNERHALCEAENYLRLSNNTINGS